MLAGHLQLDSPLFPRNDIEPERLNAPPVLERALPAPEALPSFSQLIVPAFSLEPPPEASLMKLRTMSAAADGLHSVMPNRRFEYVSRAAQAILGVMHVTKPAPAGRV